MTLTAGSRLGPYEILSPLGAGGMGEVYRARDAKLGRDVAIKVLPEKLAGDPSALERFEREAKAVAALSHPNILGIHDLGREAGASYAVMELLTGETLRQRLEEGPLPQRKALEYSLQIAAGLAAAHEKGIVHRDLKPENIFVTAEGRVKILDFGLAKVFSPEPDETQSPTAAAATEPGTVMGTVGYMSPEQVRGKPADPRSDIFSFGCVLYEMLSGERAFRGDSAAETMAAIAQKDPAELAEPSGRFSTPVERILRHCLEKRPAERFDTAHDLAFALETVLGTAASGRTVAEPPRARRRWLAAAGTAAAVLLAIAGAYRLGLSKGGTREGGGSFSQLTFRQQPIFNARFAPDGKTVVYSAASAGNTPEILLLRPDYPGASTRGLSGVHLLSVSSRGELAVLTRVRYLRHQLFEGTLAQMPLEGGAPREILNGVREADWSPDGKDMAVIRDVGGKDRLEYPVGKVLCETGGYLSNPRFSPRGDRIAFFEHPIKYDDRGSVAVVDLAGRKTVLSEGYWGEEGLSWSSDGDDVLFSAGTAYNNFKVYAVSLSGRRRVALQSAGGLTIQDVRKDGKWIVTRDDLMRDMQVLAPGQEHERDLSWLDLSDPIALSRDSKALLFSEESGILGANYSACLRGTDGSPVVRLGEGAASDLSRDGRWALAVVPTSPQQLIVYPTGAGELRRLEGGGILSYESARFFPDGRRVLACGHEQGHAVRCYVLEISGGKPRAVTPEGTSFGFVSPGGEQILTVGGAAGLLLFPAAGGQARPVAGATPEDSVIGFSADGRSLLVFHEWEVPTRVERLDLATGRREPVRTLGSADLTGVLQIVNPVFSEDLKTYAYARRRMLSQLYLVEGAR